MGRADDIRTAALELFTRLGYEATTMADIGRGVGIRGPSLYKHVTSKQDVLAQIIGTMEDLLAAHRAAVASSDGPVSLLRRATEAHLRYHARHRLEAFVVNREIRSLVEPHRSRVLALRAEYEAGFRSIVEAGVKEGCFTVASPRLVSYAVLDLGIGDRGLVPRGRRTHRGHDRLVVRRLRPAPRGREP
ncbi:TetR/AcrR family transcriptional regulator [Streptomyces sp. NPDC058676]|uniref:TetR/AcrR family transcriptional regulator n=1 Tax=unclassified Streptomyces TaxID=2593676 RepID=UPI00364AD343